MDSIKEKSMADVFPFDVLRKLHPSASPDLDKSSEVKVRSYDNRGRISDVAAALQSKLGYFRTRVAESSFLSEAFSWQVKTAITSDPDRLLAKAAPGYREKEFSVRINSLATRRTAVSDKKASNDAAGFLTAKYSYNLTIGTDTVAIDLDIENKIGAQATNRSVLLGLERSINRLGLDVTAELIDTKERDYNPYRENIYKDFSYLIVKSNTTGEDIEFSLSDTSGDLIEKLGLDRVTSFGLKNQYSIDGSTERSNFNDISFDSGNMNAFLAGTTDAGKTLQISVTRGKDILASELTYIINDYNELIQWIDDNYYAISPSLKTTLFKDIPSIAFQDNPLKINTGTNLNRRAEDFGSVINQGDKNILDKDFSNIGLTLNNDGTIDVNDNFTSFVAGNLREVYDTLAGTQGFFTKISEAIDRIHGTNERNYVFSSNYILSYDASGNSRQSIYKTGSSDIISFFA